MEGENNEFNQKKAREIADKLEKVQFKTLSDALEYGAQQALAAADKKIKAAHRNKLYTQAKENFKNHLNIMRRMVKENENLSPDALTDYVLDKLSNDEQELGMALKALYGEEYAAQNNVFMAIRDALDYAIKRFIHVVPSELADKLIKNKTFPTDTIDIENLETSEEVISGTSKNY